MSERNWRDLLFGACALGTLWLIFQNLLLALAFVSRQAPAALGSIVQDAGAGVLTWGPPLLMVPIAFLLGRATARRRAGRTERSRS